MDLHSLKLFIHLSHSLHFNKTSRACFISPSGLTRAIQRLESEIGAPLLERDNRKVRLTNSGVRLQKYGTEILDKWNEYREGLKINREELEGNINIYCSVTASYSILQPVINRFRNSHPKVHIMLETGEAEAAVSKVISSETDICIASLPEKIPASLISKIQTEIPLILIAPRIGCSITEKLSKRENWYTLPLILPIHGLARKRINSFFRENNIKPDIYADVAGNEAIIAMTALGCGIGLVPELVLKESAHLKEVAVLESGPELEPYRVGFCTRKSKLKNKVINEFWEMIP
jgi:LysR family transcriptional regulator, positive regulator for ilvC